MRSVRRCGLAAVLCAVIVALGLAPGAGAALTARGHRRDRAGARHAGVHRHRHRHHHRHTRRPRVHRRRPSVANRPIVHAFPACTAADSSGYATAGAPEPAPDPRTVLATFGEAYGVLGAAADELPAGTAPSDVTPRTLLQADCFQSPNTVGYYELWHSPLDLEALLRAVAARTPSGTTTSDFSSQGQPGALTSFVLQYVFPGVAGVSESRTQTITAVAAAGDTSEIEVSGQAIFLLARPASERVPAGVASVTLTFGHYSYSSGAPEPQETTSTDTTTDPSQIASIVGLTDALPLDQPGPPCADGPGGDTVTVTFSDVSGDPLAVAGTSGCEYVGFSIGGVAQPTLSGGGQWLSQLESMFGIGAYDSAG